MWCAPRLAVLPGSAGNLVAIQADVRLIDNAVHHEPLQGLPYGGLRVFGVRLHPPPINDRLRQLGRSPSRAAVPEDDANGLLPARLVRYDEAEAHLQRAERMFTLGGTATDLGILRGEQARLAAAQGDADTALAYATETAELLDRDARYRSNVLHALAAAYEAGDRHEEAEEQYRLALQDLERLRQWREASQVGRELSQVLRKLGRDDEAYDVLDRASLLTVRHLGVAQGRLRDEPTD